MLPADNYSQLDQRTHVYRRSDMYTGSASKLNRQCYVFYEGKIVQTSVDFPDACEVIFNEILANACDNVNKSVKAGVDPGTIEVSVDQMTVRVKNGGVPIACNVVKTTLDGRKIYLPQFIFGEMLTGSNYDDSEDRDNIGKNGVGAKAANIFSKYFAVDIYDNINHLHYTQNWTENMTTCSEPIIEPYHGSASSVEIIYIMDFPRFEYQNPYRNEEGVVVGGYPPEVIALFSRKCLDISFTAKIPVVFNGVKYEFFDIKDYARLYFGDDVNNSLIHRQYLDETKKNKNELAVEMIVVDTPDNGQLISFVNKMMTPLGGVHVDRALEKVGRPIVNAVNSTVLQKLSKKEQEEISRNKSKANSYKIDISDFKRHTSMILVVRVSKPEFDSQPKRQLRAPAPAIHIEDNFTKKMEKWRLTRRLIASIEAKQFEQAAKSTKSAGRVASTKVTDANLAGPNSKVPCTLLITEGDSAGSYAENMVAHLNAADTMGVLRIRGKGLNVMNANPLRILKNKEVVLLKKVMGLVDGIDYSLEENFKRIRYRGGVMIMADSDVDGKHIVGLIINFFHCLFPSLLHRGCISFLRTPILRVRKGGNSFKFFNLEQYEQWKQATPDFDKWKHKYFKGLGSAEDSELADDCKQPRQVQLIYDNQAPEYVVLAFAKEYADSRKEWIKRFEALPGITEYPSIPVSMFFDKEFAEFSRENIIRALPRIEDGMKESQRKIVYAASNYWSIGKNKNNEIKLAQFAGYVLENTVYQHAETNIPSIINKMAVAHPGTNNINLFAPKAQFGTFRGGYKDGAAARYQFTLPESIWYYIFRKEDEPILRYLHDEGMQIEPEVYYPVVPMILVNGCKGIGTGHSTFIPNHDPLEIVDRLIQLLNGKQPSELAPLYPWFNGFNGYLNIINQKTDKAEEALDSKPDEFADPPEDNTDPEIEAENDTAELERTAVLTSTSLQTIGRFHVEGKNIVITELPIGRCAKEYCTWLDKLESEKKIKKYSNNTTNKVLITIQGFTEEPNITNLRLKCTYGLTNMVALDEYLQPRKFSSALEILVHFYKIRIKVYEKRKAYQLEELQRDLDTLIGKHRFVLAVVNGEIEVLNKDETVIEQRLQELGIDIKYYHSTQIRSCSANKLLEISKSIETVKAKMAQLAATSPQQLMYVDLEQFVKAYNSGGYRKPTHSELTDLLKK